MIITLEDAQQLNTWYTSNKRALPWRDTGDPYDVWLSEIMLQQTRIEAVIPKFLAFKQDLPDIPSLAACSEDHLMRLWEGLGYYSRARNLRKCAIVLMEQYGGKLPSDDKSLLKLPGIGPYTAGAIASIAFGQAVPAIDGNVLRVIARVCHITDDVRDPKTHEKVEDLLSDIYQANQPAGFYQNFNQGLMELGETLCAPNGAPVCEQCPWKWICVCHQTDDWNRIPFRSALKKRKIVERTLLVIRQQNTFLLHKRPKTGLLAGLYEFPGVDRYLTEDEAMEEVKKMGFAPVKIKSLPEAKHIFTHLEWHMKAYEIQVRDRKMGQLHMSVQAEASAGTSEAVPAEGENSNSHMLDYIAVDRRQIQSMAIPSAFRKYVDYYSLR